MEFHHVSVMLNEVIDALNIKPDGIYVDGTLGGAGHSKEIVKKLTTGRLIGIDQDTAALRKSEEVLADYMDKVTLVHGNYSYIKSILRVNSVDKVDGILLDLGVSSHQLDTEERGFSYNKDAPLDMRMDTTAGMTAWDVVNNYTEEELEKIIWDYGEEKWAKRIAKFIVEDRKEKPIDTTLELVTTIKKAIPKKVRAEGHHPAKKTFQAIRIEVNDELGVLTRAINDMADCLVPGGRLAIITFHSLEDRIVKEAFRELYRDCVCPPELPVCVCDKVREIEIITRKPLEPSKEELNVNPRSRSAKLRVAEKL
ncbi:MAG: 16S rRNA (cytosine(1402)-N(4))-methyltransferase RsmH [Gudongella sp.]|jgi:16S rRNA (cytosine1402-N4)-methyltransferase|nr:16S rRNA (cytosine(1402)-N(4))-methyltransferase RsmH [Gudongella sp.]